MFRALQEAEKAADAGEVPVGALIVHASRIIGTGYNQMRTLLDATAHAEMIAITAASATLGSQFLDDCTLYVTLEPCVMCTGAILLSRIPRVYFSAFDPKFGAMGSIYNVAAEGKMNFVPEVFSGIYEKESAEMLKKFFADRRN
ncbi:MAG: nucleoside deaminase [Ignavibacteriaceae bacterium]|nr:nucleoside deaminase [Ignavibacteriaceae bacterium]